jgi:hypothetical protein
LNKFLRGAQNEFNSRINKIRSNSRTKSKNTQVEKFLEEEGIKNEFSSPYSPQKMEWWKRRIKL